MSKPKIIKVSSCSIWSEDGGFGCYTHNKQWGCVWNPSKPCKTWPEYLRKRGFSTLADDAALRMRNKLEVIGSVLISNKS